MKDMPQLFRVMLEVGDLDNAVEFYSTLLDLEGRKLRGSRAYFDCGTVILAIVDPTPGGVEPKPNSADVYFSVKNLEEIFSRAQQLKCLAKSDIHGARGGEILTRPWGELSFYAEDPWANGLCFVDETTLYTGR